MNVPKRPEVPADQFAEALEIEPRAIVPWDPVLFGNAATNAQPLAEISPKSKAVAEMQKVAAMLLGRNDSFGKKSGFNLKSLFAKRA